MIKHSQFRCRDFSADADSKNKSDYPGSQISFHGEYCMKPKFVSVLCFKDVLR